MATASKEGSRRANYHREVVTRNNNTGHPCLVIGMNRI